MKKSDSNFLIKKYLKKSRILLERKLRKKLSIRDGWEWFGYTSVQGLKNHLRF